MLNPVFERIGHRVVAGLQECGQATLLLWEAVGWILLGRRRGQAVRWQLVLAEAVDVGLRALPILGILSFSVGAMLAVQGVYSLAVFGAERQVILGLALSVVREFAPLMTGILVAGRSGSALAARIGTMTIREEVAALTVIGINPLRQLVAPPLMAMLFMLPLMTWFAAVAGLLGGGLYVWLELGLSPAAFWADVTRILGPDDVLHGLSKSMIFAVLITLVGVVNGAGVKGGAEGVGQATTRSVVQAITAIVVTDMIFAFLSTR